MKQVTDIMEGAVKLFLTLPTQIRALQPLIEENNVADGGYSWTERKTHHG